MDQVRADYFEMLAGIGITKHIGSLAATEELVRLCHIGPDSYVLDVGSGIGATPIYLAKKHGCRVMGVDITPAMIDRSYSRLKGSGVEDKVEFRVGDAEELPFEDDTFDAVIIESVLAFVEDRPKAMREFVRVTVPGGYVGFTEATWKEAPPQDADDYMTGVTSGKIETVEAWEEVLKSANLIDTVAKGYSVDVKAEASGRMERLGCLSSLAAFPRLLLMFFKSISTRHLMKGALSAPKSAFVTMGYGVYAGRVPGHEERG